MEIKKIGIDIGIKHNTVFCFEIKRSDSDPKRFFFLRLGWTSQQPILNILRDPWLHKTLTIIKSYLCKNHHCIIIERQHWKNSKALQVMTFLIGFFSSNSMSNNYYYPPILISSLSKLSKLSNKNKTIYKTFFDEHIKDVIDTSLCFNLPPPPPPLTTTTQEPLFSVNYESPQEKYDDYVDAFRLISSSYHC
jgi:hypothetical protein